MATNNRIDDGSNFGDQLTQNLLESAGAGSIFSAKPLAKYLSGARCILRVNGKIVGFAFGISWNIKTEATEIETIDDYLPYELAPQRISVSGQISGFRIPGSGPTKQQIQADILSFLHQRYVEIEVRDSQTNNLLFLTRKALITGRSENVRSDALAEMNLQFKAIGWADEKAPEIPRGVGEPSVDVTGTDPLTNVTNKIKKIASDVGDFLGF